MQTSRLPNSVSACLLLVSVFLQRTLAVPPPNVIRQPVQDNQEYDWLCPRVICYGIPDECQYLEYIVLQYNYRVQGRIIDVRCQSCPYCLDFPEDIGRRRRAAQTSHMRRRRSLYDLLGWTNDVHIPELCPVIECPGVAESCNDVRLTDVITRGRHCQDCPACYDETVMKTHTTL